MTDRRAEVEARIEQPAAGPPRFTDERVTMAHGAGGKASRKLVEGVFVPAFANEALAALGDAAAASTSAGGRVAITTDAFVVTPIRFPGGSIGELAVNGTVNDLAVSGARPVAITASFILEEGVAADVVRAEAEAMAAAAAAAGVASSPATPRSSSGARPTRCTSRRPGSGCPTTGLALAAAVGRARRRRHRLRPDRRPRRGDHARSRRPRAWRPTCAATPRRCGRPSTPCSTPAAPSVRWMRDATRGGVATVLNELALAAEVSIVLDEQAVPVAPGGRRGVRAARDRSALRRQRGTLRRRRRRRRPSDTAARRAAGRRRRAQGRRWSARSRADPAGRVLGRTTFGGHRMIDMLVGDPLPRIC